MINDIKGLIDLQKKTFILLGNKDFHKDLLITIPGCKQKDLNKLKKHKIELPPTYFKLIKNLNFQGKIIGYFCLSTHTKSNANFIDEFILSTQDPFFPKEFMEKHRMYQVGSYNTDLLCITCGTDQFQEGEILFVEEGYDIYNPEDSQIHRLARDFEQFLIIAGNLEEIHTEMNDEDYTYEQKQHELLERLKKLNVSEDYHSIWLSFV